AGLGDVRRSSPDSREDCGAQSIFAPVGCPLFLVLSSSYRCCFFRFIVNVLDIILSIGRPTSLGPKPNNLLKPPLVQVQKTGPLKKYRYSWRMMRYVFFAAHSCNRELERPKCHHKERMIRRPGLRWRTGLVFPS